MSGTASAPASAGNLGPGFDTIALALELRCTVTAEPAPGWLIEQDGSITEPGEDDLVVRAVRMAVGRTMRLAIHNEIPRTRGLGSSSAVTAAAAAAAMRAVGAEVDPEGLCILVAELEGHEDNAAAAVYGGLVLASQGVVRHLELSPQLNFLVAVPEEDLPTSRARAVLNPTVERAAAVRNLARFGFLLEGLRTGSPEALRHAAGDELHQTERASLAPRTEQLMSVATDAGALHAAWSGAGPAVLAVCFEDQIPHLATALDNALAGSGKVLHLEVARAGVL